MDLENFDFKSYLIKIGLEEKYAKMPVVIEVLKNRLKVVKEDDEFEITDNGIYYRNGMIRLDKGKLRISPNSFFTEKNDVYVYIEDEFSKYKISVLDEFGTIQKIIYSKKHSYADEYERVERLYELDTPIIESVVTYNEEEISQDFIADHGDPVSLNPNAKSFEENYNYFTRKYPELKKWYEDRYKISNKDIKEYSEELRNRQNDLSIRLINEQIERFNSYIEEAKNRKQEYQEKLDSKMSVFMNCNFIKRFLYKPLIKDINVEFKKIDEKNEYKIKSDDEKLKIEHEKLDKDYTNPLSEREKELEKLKNIMIDKKIELHNIERNIGDIIKKIEIIKLKMQDVE